MLTDAWPSLRDQDAAGLRRLLWLIDQRHRDSSKVIDSVTAEPIAALLLDEERPWEAGKFVADFLREWLLALILGDTPVGQRSRTRRACTDGP